MSTRFARGLGTAKEAPCAGALEFRLVEAVFDTRVVIVWALFQLGPRAPARRGRVSRSRKAHERASGERARWRPCMQLSPCRTSQRPCARQARSHAPPRCAGGICGQAPFAPNEGRERLVVVASRAAIVGRQRCRPGLTVAPVRSRPRAAPASGLGCRRATPGRAEGAAPSAARILRGG